MRKGKHVLLITIFLLAVVIMGAGLYFYPVWQAAKVLREKMDFSGSYFVVEVELDSGRLPQEQAEMFGALARFTGIPQESMYRLTIKGETQDDRTHMLIYPEGQPEPLAEVYFSDDTGVINETMLYDAVRRHLVGDFPLLDYLMPRQEETLYMTFEQVEQLFGADLSGMRSPALPTMTEGFTVGQYFFMLTAMSREKLEDGYRFGMEREQMKLWFDISGGKGNETTQMGFSVEGPWESSSQGGELLSKLGMEMEGEGSRTLKSFSMVLEPGGGDIAIPSNLANQKTIDIISKIRIWIEENIN